MRKLLCFILAFTMLFTSVAASAAMSSDKIPAFLDKAGIIAEGTYADDTKVITRGEFAQMVAKLINIDNYKGLSTTQIFKDVPMDSPIFDVTTLLYQMYFVVGDGNGYFEPDANITAEAACKILVNLMGDQYFAKYYGGYIPAAAAKGILNGVELDANSNITVKAAMKLIYNTMIADISNSNMYDGNATTNNPEKEMFMSKRLGIYMTEGTVIDDGVTSMVGNTSIAKGQIKIGQKVFENQTGMDDLLGYTVEGFYKYDEDLDKNILIFAYINENKTDVLELNDYDIANYSNLEYEYYIDETQDEIEEAYLNANYRLIYNGHIYSTETKEATFTKTMNQMLKPETGSVKLIDTDGDGYYDLVNVTDYTVVVVESIDIENYMVYGDKEFTDVTVNLGTAREELTIQDSVGVNYVLDTINKGSVLLIARSADGKCAKVLYSNEKVAGVLSTHDGTDYYVGETAYSSLKTFRDYMAAHPTEIKIGDNTCFYFAADGRIAYAVLESEDSIKVGYLYNLEYKTSLDDKLTLRILTSGSDISDFEVANRVIADGKLYKNKETLGTYLEPFKAYLIRYRVNGDGYINFIDTPYDAASYNPNYMTESDDSLHIMKNVNNVEAYYNYRNQTFSGGLYAMDASTDIYIIPTNEEIDRAYVTDYNDSRFANTVGGFTTTAYSTKVGSLIAEHIIYPVATRYSAPYGQRPSFAVITRIKDVLNTDGEPVKKVTLCTGDRYVDYLTESSTSLVCTCGKGTCETNPIVASVGDVVTYAVNDNVIMNNGIFVCYDYSQGEIINPGGKGYCSSQSHNTDYGYLHAFDRTKMTLGVGAPNATETRVIMPFYLNKTQGSIGEFIFDQWYVQSSGNSGVIEQAVGTDPDPNNPIKRVLSMSSAFIVRIDVANNKFDAIRVNDMKAYNDGDGPIEKGLMVLNEGRPSLIIYYK